MSRIGWLLINSLLREHAPEKACLHGPGIFFLRKMPRQTGTYWFPNRMSLPTACSPGVPLDARDQDHRRRHASRKTGDLLLQCLCQCFRHIDDTVPAVREPPQRLCVFLVVPGRRKGVEAQGREAVIKQ